jgi:Leucine-rich repeat (LRR) protein
VPLDVAPCIKNIREGPKNDEFNNYLSRFPLITKKTENRMNRIIYCSCLVLFCITAFAQGQSNDGGEGVFYTIDEAKKEPLSVKVLILEHQNFDKVPEALSLFVNIEVLSLKGNSLSTLPSYFSTLLHLHDLNLAENIFSVIPEELFKMPALKIMNIYGNQLTEIPEHITELKSLYRLNVSYNKITKLPTTLFDLKELNTLNVSHNMISVLPEEFCRLTTLHYLYLGHNKITQVHHCIATLVDLSLVDLEFNDQLAVLPVHMESMKSLRLINLKGTKISRGDVERFKKALPHTMIDF